MYNKTIIRPDEFKNANEELVWDKNAMTEVITLDKPIKNLVPNNIHL